ncbi:MAG: FixH family protein [Pseudomonadota bacterium]
MNTAPRELKGWHVLAIALSAFAVIIGANMTMLFSATGSFPGLVVKNSYVASQHWNRLTATQRALGWQVGSDYEDGILTVRLTDESGAPVPGLAVQATVGLPATDVEDREIALREAAAGYFAPVPLAAGQWRVALRAVDAEGRSFRAESVFYTRGHP